MHMHWVTSVEYVSEYKLLIGFDDGSTKLVDLRPHLYGEIFEPLKDIKFFRKARFDPEIETVTWENEADFAPEFLYEIGEDVTAIPGKVRKLRTRRVASHLRNRRVAGSRLRAAQTAKR
jgi:hypothetical protein